MHSERSQAHIPERLEIDKVISRLHLEDRVDLESMTAESSNVTSLVKFVGGGFS